MVTHVSSVLHSRTTINKQGEGLLKREVTPNSTITKHGTRMITVPFGGDSKYADPTPDKTI